MRKSVMLFWAACVGGILFVPGVGALDNTSSPFVYPEYSKTISMDFQDAALVDVLKIFSKQTNLNLITSEDILNKKITMYLDKVPVEQALEQLLRANNLTYELQPGSNIYIVKPLTKPDAELVTRVYPFKHAMVSQSKLRMTVAIAREDGTLIGSDQAGASANPSGILGALEAILTPKGKIVEDPRTNSLVVTDIATNFPNIERTISRLDVPVPQILIEVEMLEVSKGVTDKLGVKMGDTPFSFTGAYRNVLYPFHQGRILDSGVGYGSNVLDDDSSQYFTGTLDFRGLTATVQFLKTLTGTKSLARPRILTLSNEPAEIKIATNEAIGSTTTTVADSISESSQEAERVETGVFLTVTPQANVASDEIIMAIIPKVIQARTGATFGDITYRDPEQRGTQSILRVKSGETIILGGLMREEKSTVTTKVPVLGDIPLLGQAFRHKDETSSEKELIVFITPHILAEEAEEEGIMTAPAPQVIRREQDQPQLRSQRVAEELANFEQQPVPATVN